MAVDDETHALEIGVTMPPCLLVRPPLTLAPLSPICSVTIHFVEPQQQSMESHEANFGQPWVGDIWFDFVLTSTSRPRP